MHLAALTGALLFTGLLPAAAPELPAAQPSTAARRIWSGPEGLPLPFTSDEEVVEFLRTATVIDSEPIPVGVTAPRKLLLEQGGVRAHAVFRDVEIIEERVRLTDGRFVMFLRDSYVNEVAAYRLSRVLGISNLPPAVERRVGGASGSLQIWIESAMTEGERQQRSLEPPDRTRWRRQLMDMKAFDNLINNIDRNQGNMLIDGSWNLWLVDHTRSFGREWRLPEPQQVLGCSRSLWQRLQQLDLAAVEEALGPYLSSLEVRAVLKRRKLLVDRLQKRIAKRGEAAVLFGD